MSNADAHITAKLGLVLADENAFHRLSTGERIAVAFVLDRFDLLHDSWGTMLEAIHRLGDEWTQAALRVQRNRCE